MKPQPNRFRDNLGPVFFLASIFFVSFLARIILSPLMPTIQKDLGLSHGKAGSLFFLITVGQCISILGCGFLSSKWSHRRTIIISAASLGLVLLAISLSRSAGTLGIALFLLGMSGGLYLPSGVATITSLVHPKHWGKALALHDLGPNLAFVMAPLISEALLGWTSWQGVLALLGGISLLVGMGFARFGKGGDFPGEAPGAASFAALLRNPAFWVVMVLFALGIGASTGIYSMLPLYLVIGHGMERSWANTLVALSRIPGLGIAFLAGWANDRLGARKTLFAVFLLTGISTLLLGSVRGTLLTLLVFLQPTLSACFFPAGLAALSSIGPQSKRSTAVSLSIPLAFLFGGGAIPSMIGLMGDAGAFGLGVALVGGLTLLGCLLALTLKPPDGKG